MRRLLITFALWIGALVLPARAELFVSSFNLHQVFRYHETTGAFLDIFVPNTNGLLNLPHGLAFGPDGHLYVASAGNDAVLRYDGTNGAFRGTLVPAGSGSLDYPVTLIFRPDGLLYVSSQLNDRVLRYHAGSGAFVDVFVTNSPALDGPSDMVFGPDGHLYVVGRFNSRVARYHGTNGTLIDQFVMANVAQPFGLRFTTAGELLVASGNQNLVQRFGATTGAFLGSFPATGGLNLPIGIVHGPDGNHYVASYNNHKVVRYQAGSGVVAGDFVTAGSGGLSGPNFMLFRPPMAPRLELARSSTNTVLSWTNSSFVFRLERSAGGLGDGQWTSVSNAVTTAGGTNQVSLPMESTNRYFRLRTE